MSRESIIGKRQGQVLMVAWAMMPRAADSRILALIGDPEGDLTRGRRVLAALEARGMLSRDFGGQNRNSPLARYVITEAGMEALKMWLSRWSPRYPGQ